MTHWLLQQEPFQENLYKFVEEIKRQGHTCEVIDKNTTVFHTIKTPVISYCSLELASRIRKLDYYPGVWCDLNKMKCTSYYPYYGKFLLNSPYTFIPFGEIDRLRTYLFNAFFDIYSNDDIFIRPDSGAKPYSGGLLGLRESLTHFLGGKTIFPEELCVVSRRLKIRQEWRLVVCGNEIITGSQYHKNGLLDTESGAPDEVLEFGNSVIENWKPERCFTLDVGKTEEGNIGLVEINSFSCSGLYECDISKVVEFASLEAEREYDDFT